MGFLLNPSTASSGGSLTLSEELKVLGKVGFNGATPVGKATTTSTLSTSLSTGLLLTETITQLNATNKVVNELSLILKNVGLMA